jgi:hypothetical protein
MRYLKKFNENVEDNNVYDFTSRGIKIKTTSNVLWLRISMMSRTWKYRFIFYCIIWFTIYIETLL